MDKFLKNKQLMIGVVVVVLLLLGGAFFLTSNKKATTPVDTTENIVIADMKPEEIGLTLALSPDNKKVKFSADKLEGVKHLEWEFAYDADIPADVENEGAEEGAKITQSFGGETDVTSDKYESVLRELGTCSTGGKCRYDTGIEKVDILLKVTKSDGKIYQVKDSISL